MFKVNIGGIKALLDRLKANVAFFQFPLLVYLSSVNTMEYIFGSVEFTYSFLFSIIFIVGLACSAMVYVDYKWVFPAEMSFMFRNTGHLEMRFNSVENALDTLIGSEC